MNKHKSNKIKENSWYSETLDNGTDHNHSKSCCDQRSPARRTMISWGLQLCINHGFQWVIVKINSQRNLSQPNKTTVWDAYDWRPACIFPCTCIWPINFSLSCARKEKINLIIKICKIRNGHLQRVKLIDLQVSQQAFKPCLSIGNHCRI